MPAPATFATGLAEHRGIIGVLHVPPLVAEHGVRDFGELLGRVTGDAQAYAVAGFDAVILENFGDAPFDAERVEPHVLTLLTTLGIAVRGHIELSLGVNVLRNDACGALAVATAIGGAFVRVNVLAGVVATDQGIIEGRAAAVARYRRQLGSDIALLADVDVKHGTPLWGASITERAHDLADRAGADALIVTGVATGAPAAADDVAAVARACAGTPVLVGSGVTPDNAACAAPARGVIVGSWVKRDGNVHAPVDADRAEALVSAVRRVWAEAGG